MKVLLLLASVLALQGAYVQGNYAVPQTPQTTVSVTYLSAQVAGDLNVIAVGWNDSTAKVSTITDKSGNTYSLAVGPTSVTGALSQSIYYATNIKAALASANVVTITFSVAAQAPDIRIIEESGTAGVIDVTAVNAGTSTLSTSGAKTTTNANDLLIGANMTVNTTTGAGSGFTKRLLTSPDADIIEDATVTTVGSYSATAPITPTGSWVMQLVAFKIGTVTPPSTYSITSSVNGLANGTYPLTAPVIAGYTVTPATQSVTVNGANVTVPPFTAKLTVVVTNHAVNLAWGAGTLTCSTPPCSTTQVIAGYNVYRANVSGGPYTLVNPALITGLAYIDTNVSSGQTWYYVAKTQDNLGNTSANSNQATAVIP